MVKGQQLIAVQRVETNARNHFAESSRANEAAVADGLLALGHESRDRELVQRTVARFDDLGLGAHVAETPAYL